MSVERPTTALEVDDLAKAYGETVALAGLSFEVSHGEVVALLGPNGAGKTTAMRCIAGVLAPDAGRISIVDAEAGSPQAQAAVSYLPEHPELYPGLSVAEHLRFVALAHRLEGWEPQADELLTRFQLADRADDLPGELSQGMRRKTALSMALLHGAQVFLLDEPFNGLDPHAAAELRDVITGLAEDGAAVLVSTHGLAVAERIAARSVVMSSGRVMAEGSTSRLRKLAGTADDADLEAVFLALTAGDATGDPDLVEDPTAGPSQVPPGPTDAP